MLINSTEFQDEEERKEPFNAIARKILIAVYHTLKTGEYFNPSDMANVETTEISV